jgi:hypothetical protein
LIDHESAATDRSSSDAISPGGPTGTQTPLPTILDGKISGSSGGHRIPAMVARRRLAGTLAFPRRWRVLVVPGGRGTRDARRLGDDRWVRGEIGLRVGVPFSWGWRGYLERDGGRLKILH